MEKNSVRITLRIPEQLHDLLTESADLGTRSLNSEIVKRLEESFANWKPDEQVLTKDVVIQIVHKELDARLGKAG